MTITMPVLTDVQRKIVEQYSEFQHWSETHPLQQFSPLVVLKPHLVHAHPSVRVDSFVKIEGGEGVYLGPNVHITSFCHLNVGGGLLIVEEGVRMGSATKLIGGTNTPTKGRPLNDDNIQRCVTHVGHNAAIFTNVIILPGRTIGENAVVAAGAVVTHDVPPGEIWAGNPAKKIGSL